MFDWIPNLYWSIATVFWIAYIFGNIVGFVLGIGYWKRRIAREEARQLAKDIEARIAECPDEIEPEETEEACVRRLLKSCDL
jgi:hypothetical protein